MRTNGIVLNGGSSSGKTSIARCLQTILAEPWMTVGTDMLVDAMPSSLHSGGPGIGFGTDGEVSVGPTFRALELAWIRGVAAMMRAGANIIIDEVFLGGTASQERWRTALVGLEVLWVGVHCDARAAAKREAGRRDRTVGMAASQAEVVHRGITYDVEVDTTDRHTDECARTIISHLS